MLTTIPSASRTSSARFSATIRCSSVIAAGSRLRSPSCAAPAVRRRGRRRHVAGFERRLELAASLVCSSIGRTFVNAPCRQVLDELVHIVVAPRDHVDLKHRAGVAIDARPHRGDPHVVGQRRLEAVEQLGPREGAAIDQVVGLARVRRRGLDLLRIDGRAQPGRLRAQIGGARLVARGLRGELACRCASSG